MTDSRSCKLNELSSSPAVGAQNSGPRGRHVVGTTLLTGLSSVMTRGEELDRKCLTRFKFVRNYGNMFGAILCLELILVTSLIPFWNRAFMESDRNRMEIH